VLAVLIGSRFIPEKSAEQPLPSKSSQSSQVTVNTDAEKGKEVVVATPNTSQPAITENGADSSGTDQTIQGDVSRPPAPSKEQLTDPSQKPNSSANTGSENGTSTDGSSQSGDGLPGFDNVPDGGANQVTDADDMYENGNKIGNMD
jgi:hypothetical protein